jgi:protein-disulfide isomerase
VIVRRIAFAIVTLVFNVAAGVSPTAEQPRTAAPTLAEEAPAPDLGPRAEKLIPQGLPVCSAATKISRAALQHKLPANLTGAVLRVESERSSCSGQWVAVVSREGGFFMGVPWFLDGSTGTIEEKLKAFGWNNLHDHFTPVVDREKVTREGFFNVTMSQTTERGKVPLEGEVDPAGTVVFIGHFLPLNAELRDSRTKYFQPFIDSSPATGAAKPTVTVVEFSDFQCPSCQQAAGYVKPILEKYPDQIRYIRYDLPLLSIHPWAFSAAVAGRAIHRQKPEAFWAFKEQVYANQEKLSAFTFDDFARGFARDHELDLTKYDADVSSPELQASILAGVGIAFSNDIRATPTYLVNGITVDPGDGKALEKYIENAIKGPAKPDREKTSTSGR